MNARPSSCDALHEPISLLAADGLPRPLLIRHAIHELARAETDADFDAALRRRYGTATFGGSTSQSRPRDLMKELLQ